MEAYIVKAYRTAVGKAKKGSFKNYRSDDLAIKVIQHIANDTPQLDPSTVDDVFVGCANPEGEQGLQMGRQISLRALGQDVPGVTVNRYCASGLETIAMAVGKIKAGMGHIFVAGGAESMSMIPMAGYKFAPNYDVATLHPDYIVSMGVTAEAVARKYGITREMSDEFAVRSHQRAAKAIDSGRFKSQIVPITVKEVWVENGVRKEREFVMDTDEGVRRDTSMAGLAKLRPVFAKNGVATAGNSSQTSDGAAFTLVMSEEMVKKLNVEPIA
ncbi:MAG TPA: thiolase family protein, partial [Saprospiraceae bacterium]|nr:thiolase family protein [Saprospiraceae bacterium]